MRRSKPTGVRLWNKEENETFLRGESCDFDVLIFLVLQSVARKGVSNVDSCKVCFCTRRPLCGFVKFSLTAILNIWAMER